MSLTEFAKKELQIAGAFDSDSDYEGGIGKKVLNLVEMFAKQGHSGSSASLTLAMFEKVANYKPIIPLTGKDDEWILITDDVYQNSRCPVVFKDKTGAYNIEGRLIETKTGSYDTSKSKVYITFPYTPVTEIVKENSEK